jgi:hypothetical protein
MCWGVQQGLVRQRPSGGSTLSSAMPRTGRTPSICSLFLAISMAFLLSMDTLSPWPKSTRAPSNQPDNSENRYSPAQPQLCMPTRTSRTSPPAPASPQPTLRDRQKRQPSRSHQKQNRSRPHTRPDAANRPIPQPNMLPAPTPPRRRAPSSSLLFSHRIATVTETRAHVGAAI